MTNKKDKFDVALGNILKNNRIQNGLSLQNVADVLGVTRQAIFYYENARTPLTVTQVIKLCTIYNVDYATILKQAQIESTKL